MVVVPLLFLGGSDEENTSTDIAKKAAAAASSNNDSEGIEKGQVKAASKDSPSSNAATKRKAKKAE